ncbi:MAG: hypothetical protein FWD40_11240 [Treponema sp.]|nr:hypothetical protein [Treponema sp.]
MKRFIKTFLLLILTAGVMHAQNQDAYLIPRQIFVGDPAMLVLPLPATAQNDDDIIYNHPPEPNIDFHRIILERRTTGSRLMVEFTAFMPGTLELPVIEIGGEYFSGLTVTVNSLIDSRTAPALSGAASVLAMPGTALMLYGSMVIIVFIIFSALWFIFRGRALLRLLLEKWRRYRLFTSMRNTEKRLLEDLSKETDKRIILDILSDEFREFLSKLTGKNCRSLTSREFMYVFEQQEDSAFLEKFFGSCDGFRFSGEDINTQDIINLLDDLRSFLDAKEEKQSEFQF